MGVNVVSSTPLQSALRLPIGLIFKKVIGPTGAGASANTRTSERATDLA